MLYRPGMSPYYWRGGGGGISSYIPAQSIFSPLYVEIHTLNLANVLYIFIEYTRYSDVYVNLFVTFL